MKRITYEMEVEIGCVPHRYERSMLVHEGEDEDSDEFRERHTRLFADVAELIAKSPFNRVLVPCRPLLEETIP